MGTPDELTTNLSTVAVVTNVDFMDIPTKGTPGATNYNCWVTNYIYVTTLSTVPALRLIRSDAIWAYPATGVIITNTTMLVRTSDQ
jgi:hypothetical protein